MRISNERGFSVVEGLVILAVVAILGFTGWYVWRAKHSVVKNLTSNNSITQTYIGSAANQNIAVQLPAGWLWYQGDGFKFGYPKEYKQFVVGSMAYATPGTQEMFTSGTPDSAPFPGLSTSVMYVLSKLESTDTPLLSRKYGPTVKLENGKWIVTQDNPGDPKPYKVGDTYTEVTVDKSSASTTYIFISGDEGGVIYTVVFVAKNHLYTLQLPGFDTGTYGPVYSPNDQKPYDQLVTQISQHVIIE